MREGKRQGWVREDIKAREVGCVACLLALLHRAFENVVWFNPKTS